MTKIEFKNLPDTSTPLNAQNLNQLQDNVEDAIDNITIELDDTVSTSSTNGVENQAITNYVNTKSLEIYSNTETRIGTWMGKPLYRKVIQFTTTSSTYSITSQSLNLDNPDLVFIDSNSFILDGTITNPINNVRIHSNQVYNNNYSWFRANGNQVQYEVDSSFTNKTCYLIVNYTKTTD